MKTYRVVFMLFFFSAPVFSDIVVFSGVLRGCEYYYRTSDNQGIRWKGNSKVIVIADVNLFDDYVTQAYVYEYWKEGRNLEGMGYGWYNLEMITDEISTKNSSAVCSFNLYDDANIPGTLSVEGSVCFVDIGFGSNDKREIARSLKGYIIDDVPGDISGDKILGMKSISLKLQLSWTRMANNPASPMDFEQSKDAVFAYLNGKGYTDWVFPEE